MGVGQVHLGPVRGPRQVDARPSGNGTGPVPGGGGRGGGAGRTQNKSLEVYRLNKEFTRIVSPIDGQVSRYYLTLGNLVNQDQTLLTTIVSLDPMYAYFDMDERTLLNIRKALAEGKIARHADGESIPLLMGLENEDGFPHQGTVNFVNNQVNSTTGSITFRACSQTPFPRPLRPRRQFRRWRQKTSLPRRRFPRDRPRNLVPPAAAGPARVRGRSPAVVARDVRADPAAHRPSP